MLIARTDDPLVPLHLLIWSIETALTTLVCVVDVLNWPGYSRDEVLALQQLYIPYFLLGGYETLLHMLLIDTLYSSDDGHRHVLANEEEHLDQSKDSITRSAIPFHLECKHYLIRPSELH